MNKTLVKGFCALSAITLLIFLFTFPDVSPDYGPGLDPSYVWGLNWLFVHDYNTLANLIYPFGPLSFLKYPICEGNNFIFFLVFYSIIKCLFIVSGFLAAGLFSDRGLNIGRRHKTIGWLVPTILLWCACYYANIDVLIIFSCLFLSLIYIREEKIGFFLVAAGLAALSLFIKVSIGVSALAVVFVAVLVFFAAHRKVKSLLVHCAVLVGVFAALAFAVLHKPTTVANWLVGCVHLVFGYGGLSLEYDNHKFWMILYLLSLMVVPVLCREKRYRYAVLMLLVPVFAFWKHGMMREDMWHYFGMVYFMVVFWLVLSLLAKNRRLIVILVGAISVFSLLMNASEMEGAKKKMHRDFCGVDNVKGPFFHYESYVKNANDYSAWRLQEVQLPDSLLQQVGPVSIDIYPYEFSYVAQNKLHWQPRATLSTAMSPWLEAKSIRNFSDGTDATRFVLWHFQEDTYGKRSVSMDDRYFLNDEPEVVRNVLNHYKKVSASDKWMLLAHTSQSGLQQPSIGEKFESCWNEWVDVPRSDHAVVRVRVESKMTFAGKIRAVLYKDDVYKIEYQTEDGQIYAYRYDPAFALEGLWCSPFVQTPCDTAAEPNVVKVRVLIGNLRWVKPTVTMQFETIPYTILPF